MQYPTNVSPSDNDISMDDCVFEVDGDMICCHLPDFINLQESPAGFGVDCVEAFINFLDNWSNEYE